MDWIGTASVVVAVLSAVLSGWFSYISGRHSRIVSVNEYRGQLRAWAARCMVALARLERHAGEGDDASRVGEELVVLSALVEEGRLFFPNSLARQRGPESAADKEERGFRDEKLDPLVAAYRIFLPEESDPEVTDRQRTIRQLRTAFTDRMQRFLDPVNTNQTLESLTALRPGKPTRVILSEVNG